MFSRIIDATLSVKDQGLGSKDAAKLIVGLACMLLPASQSSSQTATDLDLPAPYAQTAWPSLHRDSRNSDFTPFFMPARHRFAWSRLDGAAVLPAPVIGPEGHLYVTTGRGPGTSHLHAFDRSGNLLWESAPQRSMADLDSAACFSAPLIDDAGDLYLGDRDQLWAFHSDGQVKWSVPIPGGGPFASLAFTKEGFVLGASAGGAVLVFRREDGGLAAPPLHLPGGAGPAAVTPPPGLWANGLLDPAIASDIFNLFLGRVFEVTNTPAVHPGAGRIYVTATGPTPAEGALYGIDLAQGRLSIAFATPMGVGSGTSPAISLDGERVYAADGAGRLQAFDASTGAPLWSTSGPSAASPTIGPDDTVYAGGSRLRAINPFTGQVKWARDLNALAAAVLPVLPAAPPAFLTGIPVGRTNSVVSASVTRLHVAVTLGYEYREPVSNARLIQPRVNLLLTIAQNNGAILGATGLRDTNDGIVSLGADGRLYSAHAALLSSIFYFGINQMLPPALQAPGPPPGGFSAFEPVRRFRRQQEE